MSLKHQKAFWPNSTGIEFIDPRPQDMQVYTSEVSLVMYLQ